MELKDRFGRVHDYLRLSLVDKCNLRCTYCMPEDIRFMPADQLMSRAEILHFARLFQEDFGIRKIRITGGEPLVRKDAREILEDLGKLPVQLAITTNGILLHDFLETFRKVGIQSINISLDSFDEDTFNEISRRKVFQKVMDNIDLALQEGFRIKLNMVVMRGVNEHELIDFVERTKHPEIHARFIEFMPFDGNKWMGEKVVSYAEMLKLIGQKFTIEKLSDKPNSTSKAYRAVGYEGTFSVISTVSQPFCESCNRIRLTADGKIRNCLFATQEFDLLGAYRAQKDVKALIQEAILAKEARLGGLPDFTDQENLMKSLSSRAMVKIGG